MTKETTDDREKEMTKERKMMKKMTNKRENVVTMGEGFAHMVSMTSAVTWPHWLWLWLWLQWLWLQWLWLQWLDQDMGLLLTDH